MNQLAIETLNFCAKLAPTTKRTMKQTLCLLLIGSAISSAWTQENSPAPNYNFQVLEKPLQTEITTVAYSHNQPLYLKGLRRGALGTYLRNSVEYTSAAADWSFLPLGTVFTIDDFGGTRFVVDDHGADISGKRAVKIYFDTVEKKKEWGMRRVTISIIRMGDEKVSYAKLREAAVEKPHCYQMAQRIYAKYKARERQLATEQAEADRLTENTQLQDLIRVTGGTISSDNPKGLAQGEGTITATAKQGAKMVPANTSSVMPDDLPVIVVDPVTTPEGSSTLFPPSLVPLPSYSTEVEIEEQKKPADEPL